MDVAEVHAINNLHLSCGEEDGMSVLGMFARSSKIGSILNIKAHNHSHFELHYILEGKVEYEINGMVHIVPGNHFFVVPPGRIHRLVSASKNWEKISISFELNDTCSAYKLFCSADEMIYAMPASIREGIDFIIRSAMSKKVYYRKIVEKRLQEIVYHAAVIVTDAAKIDENFAFNSDDRVERAKKYVLDNQHIFINCNDVAAYCGVSVRTMSRLFEKQNRSKQSVGDFIRDCKINEIRKRLLNSDKTQWTIATELGFSDVQYMSRYFKKYVGMTPNEYRKKYKK